MTKYKILTIIFLILLAAIPQIAQFNINYVLEAILAIIFSFTFFLILQFQINAKLDISLKVITCVAFITCLFASSGVFGYFAITSSLIIIIINYIKKLNGNT